MDIAQREDVLSPPALARGISGKQIREALFKAVVYVVLIAGGIVFIAPFAWMVSASFQPLGDMFNWPPTWIPENFTIGNYERFLEAQGLWRWFFNSSLLAISVMVVQLLVNSLAAYAYAKRVFPGRDMLFLFMLGTLMIPGQIYLIPNYIILQHIPFFNGNNYLGMGGHGWLDTYWGMIVPYSFSVWSVFFMRQYMKSIPNDLMDAARIDGASELRIYAQIILPLCGPVLAAQAIFTFTFVWNDFFWPLIVISDPKMRTLPLGLALYIVKNRTAWDVVMAGSVLSTLPVLAIFLLFQRYFIRGITLTGMKG
jgi:multiple sugar transport system permease protein